MHHKTHRDAWLPIAGHNERENGGQSDKEESARLSAMITRTARSKHNFEINTATIYALNMLKITPRTQTT